MAKVEIPESDTMLDLMGDQLEYALRREADKLIEQLKYDLQSKAMHICVKMSEELRRQMTTRIHVARDCIEYVMVIPKIEPKSEQ